MPVSEVNATEGEGLQVNIVQCDFVQVCVWILHTHIHCYNNLLQSCQWQNVGGWKGGLNLVSEKGAVYGMPVSWLLYNRGNSGNCRGWYCFHMVDVCRYAGNVFSSVIIITLPPYKCMATL